MARNGTSLGRRRFLQTGALGLGAGALGPGLAVGQGGGSVVEPTPGRVRMSGDGLGLTPADQGRLLSRLADEGRIARDSYSNGGVVGELEERFAALLGKERAVFMPTGTLATTSRSGGWPADGGAPSCRPRATSSTTRATACRR